MSNIAQDKKTELIQTPVVKTLLGITFFFNFVLVFSKQINLGPTG